MTLAHLPISGAQILPAPPRDGQVIFRAACEAMRTRFEFVLIGEGEPHLRAAAEEAIAEVHACESRLSCFQPGSLISLVNRNAAMHPVRVDPDTFNLLRVASEIHTQSGGAFDLTLAPLMKAWGFRGTPHSPSEAAAAVWGMNHLILDDRSQTVHFARPGIDLDLGAIGKGHALDLAAESLVRSGVPIALLHAGTSSVKAIGKPPGERGWAIALSSGDCGQTGNPTVSLCNQSLGVSGQRGRLLHSHPTHTGPMNLINPTHPLGHILDPRSGRPAQGANTAAAICDSAAAADAWSTAALVLGRQLPPTIAGLPGHAFLIQPSEGSSWQFHGDASYADTLIPKLLSPSTQLET